MRLMPILGSAAAFLASLQERMRHLEPRKRIVFPEGDDLHLTAAARLERKGLVEPILLGGEAGGAAARLRYVNPARNPLLKSARGVGDTGC